MRRVPREKLGLPRPRRDHDAPCALLEVAARAQRLAVRGLGGAAGAHRLDVVAVPAGLQRLAARVAAALRSQEQGDSRLGAEPTCVHGEHFRITGSLGEDRGSIADLDAAVPSA